MSCRCAPALIHLRDQLNKKFPKRDTSSDGCCASSAHHQQNPNSDHEPDANGYAHAYDVDEDLDGASAWSPANPAPLTPWVPVLLKDQRTKYVIYERRIYYPDGTVHDYHGLNAHEHHLHLSIKPTATFDQRDWTLPRKDDPVMPGYPITPGTGRIVQVGPERVRIGVNVDNGHIYVEPKAFYRGGFEDVIAQGKKIIGFQADGGGYSALADDLDPYDKHF